MKNGFYLIVLSAVLLGFAGCQDTANNEYLIVDIRQGDVLTYKMVSLRDIVVDLDPEGKMSKGKKSVAKSSAEKLEITAKIRLKNIDEQGYMVVEMSYPSVKVSRKGVTVKGGDAVEGLQGKTTILKMTPAGFIVDDTEFIKLVQNLGDRAFASKGSRDIKSQDMIADFVTMQYYMWDVVSAVKDPLDGVKLGQSWSSELPIPLPLLAHMARVTEYTVSEIQEKENGQRVAVIDSSYVLKSKRPESFPSIYSGRAFQQRGFFGVLRVKPKNLNGQGHILYDIDKGVLIKDTQKYTLETTAALFISLPGMENGVMKVSQTLSIELVNED